MAFISLRPFHLTRRLAALALPATLLCGAPAQAQEPPSACPEGRISSVFVDNHSVFDLSDPALSPRFSWAYRAANSVHLATREPVIRRELLFREGDCYDVERLRDSERLLRGLGFIAEVDVFGVRQADGSVHVIVDTQDEWSLRVDARVGESSSGRSGLTGLRLREDNLLGTGMHLSAFFRDTRDEHVYGASFHSPQLFGSRWDAALEAGRTRVGYLVRESVTYPFVGEEGRWALGQAVHRNDRYFEFLVPASAGLERLWFPERRASFQLGGAKRFGAERFHRTLLGAALTGEWVSYLPGARFADPEQVGRIPPPLPGPALDTVSSVRAMLMFGQRDIRYARLRGLDTVNGTEDVRLGVESELAFGPSVPGLARGQDVALDVGILAGGEMPGLGLAGGQFALEARRGFGGPPGHAGWSDLFAQVNAWTYLRPGPDSRGVLVASLAAAGGWRTRTPFQLTLGSDAGLRGYPDHVDPGAVRVVGTLEHRQYLGWPLPELFDLGVVAFADVGKIWAGDAPFGVDSPVRADVGIGLRAAFPPGSRRAFRVDLGVPVHSGMGLRDLRLSAGVGQVVGLRSTRRDPQLLRSTRAGSARSIFALPGF